MSGGRLHLNKHTPLTQQSQNGMTMLLSRQSVGISGNELTRNSSGNTWSQSSQLAEPLWTDPGLKSAISLCELISTLKKCWQGMNSRTFSQNPCTWGKNHHTMTQWHWHLGYIVVPVTHYVCIDVTLVSWLYCHRCTSDTNTKTELMYPCHWHQLVVSVHCLPSTEWSSRILIVNKL